MGDPDHVRELFELARDSSLDARMRLVDTIGDLFAERETVLTERERALMLEILEKLVGDFEVRVRRQLAQRLSETPAAPRALIELLASDEIEVARPVLMRSSVLKERALIEVVRHRTRQHQLAVAMRRDVTEPVADALVDRGDTQVIQTLLKNESARISEATLAYLVEQAQTVDSFQEPLIAREDLEPKLARRLYWFVSAALRKRILERFEIATNELDDAIEEVARSLAEGTRCAQTRRNAAATLARRIAEERRIDAGLLLKVLRAGEVPLFEALFAELSGIRPPRLQQVLYETRGKGLAVVCKALEIDKGSFTPMFLLSRKGRGGEQVVDPRELSAVIAFFDSLSAGVAGEVLRSWQRAQCYQDAIETLEEDHRVGAG